MFHLKSEKKKQNNSLKKSLQTSGLFLANLKNQFFANLSHEFKTPINADEIKGYYFPSFLFDAIGSTTYSGRLYTEEKKEKEDGTTETIRNYFNISGTRETHHNNVEVEASSKLTQLELNFIKPYNLSEARAYSNEFIYGFSLEQHDTNLDKALLQAQNLMKFDIRNTILNSYDHDGVSNLDLRTSFYNQKYNYCMLPIYRINFSYKNKTYTNVMNGQTGSLGGDYPKSAGKISLVVILSILGFLLPIILFVLVAVLGIL